MAWTYVVLSIDPREWKLAQVPLELLLPGAPDKSLVSATPNYLAALVKVVAGSFGPLVQGGVYGPKYLIRKHLFKMHEAGSNQGTRATCHHEKCAALSDHTTRPF